MALCCFIIVKFGWVTKRIFQVCFWNLSKVSLWMRTGCPMACSQGIVHAGRDIIKDCLQPGLKDTYQVLFWLMRTSEDEMAGWMDHLLDGPMRWTWTWANSGRQWGTGRPGVLQSPSTLSVIVLFLTTLLSSMFTMGKQVELLQSMMYWIAQKDDSSFSLRCYGKILTTFWPAQCNTACCKSVPDSTCTVSVRQLGMTDETYSLYNLSLVTNLWAIDYVWLVSPNVDNSENVYKQKIGLALKDRMEPGQVGPLWHRGPNTLVYPKGKRWGKIFTYWGMGMSFWLYIWFSCTDQSGLLCGLLNIHCWASLVVQWLGVLRPMQGIQVQSLLWEDPTSLTATTPMYCAYRACVLEPGSLNYWALTPQVRKSECLEPVLWNKRSHHSEKPAYCSWRTAPTCHN